MRFTLTYEGALPSTGNSSRKGRAKWELRKSFHPQLMELWRTHPALNHLLGNDAVSGREGFEPIDVRGTSFIPLVRQSARLICGISIVFLRKEEPGSLVLQGGDIDNRVKTLFDALRMPTGDEIQQDGNAPNPFYCLLESDTLITEYSIKTDRLLSDSAAAVDWVKLALEVRVNAVVVTWGNISLLGD
jgi:hypothetical protein